MLGEDQARDVRHRRVVRWVIRRVIVVQDNAVDDPEVGVRALGRDGRQRFGEQEPDGDHGVVSVVAQEAQLVGPVGAVGGGHLLVALDAELLEGGVVAARRRVVERTVAATDGVEDEADLGDLAAGLERRAEVFDDRVRSRPVRWYRQVRFRPESSCPLVRFPRRRWSRAPSVPDGPVPSVPAVSSSSSSPQAAALNAQRGDEADSKQTLALDHSLPLVGCSVLLRSPKGSRSRANEARNLPRGSRLGSIATHPYDESRMNAPSDARPPGARSPRRRVSRERYLVRRIGVVAVLAVGLFGLVKAVGALVGGDDGAVVEGRGTTTSEPAGSVAASAAPSGCGNGRDGCPDRLLHDRAGHHRPRYRSAERREPGAPAGDGRQRRRDVRPVSRDADGRHRRGRQRGRLQGLVGTVPPGLLRLAGARDREAGGRRPGHRRGHVRRERRPGDGDARR